MTTDHEKSIDLIESLSDVLSSCLQDNKSGARDLSTEEIIEEVLRTIDASGHHLVLDQPAVVLAVACALWRELTVNPLRGRHPAQSDYLPAARAAINVLRTYGEMIWLPPERSWRR